MTLVRHQPPTSLRLSRSIALFVSMVLVGCSSGQLSEWTPADHDQPPDRDTTSNAPKQRNPAAGTAQLAETAWQQQCAACHGPEGRGDGPNGPMNQTPDFTKPGWGASVSDDELMTVMTQGRNKMPPSKPPPAIQHYLVRKIRSFATR